MIRGNRSGFTLIEMLVVIGIIAVLAAIIIPVYSRVQEKGRQTTCLSHLHAIGVAMRMYRMDLKAYPPPYNATDHSGGLTALYVTGYLDNWQALRCPDDPDRDNPDQYYSSYNALYNYWGYKADGTPCVADDPAYPRVSSLDAAQTYTDSGLTPPVGRRNDRNQLLWTYDADEGVWARGRSAYFPGLVNAVTSDNTVVTRCPFHRASFGGEIASQRDLTLFGANALTVSLTYNWVTQPLLSD